MTIAFEYDEAGNRSRVLTLRSRGVHIWSDARVFIAADVPPNAIEPRARLMNAIIQGPNTRIGSESVIGTSGITVMENVQTGRGVELGAGTYSECVLLHRAKIRGFAEIRPGTVIEEEVEVGHNVGLKNTILTAAVVAGSCINFCDVFVSGGTSRQDHTEIGSGAVHFNFAPNRDKFGSLIGDVSGMLMRSTPVFIGGNSGIVAPAHIGFGEIVPAGTTVRRYVAKEDAAVIPAVCPPKRAFLGKLFLAVRFIGNLKAYAEWYARVRLAGSCNESEQILYRTVLRLIEKNLAWRQAELIQYLNRILNASDLDQRVHACTAKVINLCHSWDWEATVPEPPASFMHAYKNLRQTSTHIQTVQAMSSADANIAADWLKSVVNSILQPVIDAVDSIRAI
jgi:hypothetical protein